MERVQLAINDARYASALRNHLERQGTREVRCVAFPDPALDGVIVVDSDAMDCLHFPEVDPDRVVLITRNDPEHLAQAWNAGVRSVVFSEDSLNTAVLAIMAAELRVPRCAGAHAGEPAARANAVPAKPGAKAALTILDSSVPGGKSRERRG